MNEIDVELSIAPRILVHMCTGGEGRLYTFKELQRAPRVHPVTVDELDDLPLDEEEIVIAVKYLLDEKRIEWVNANVETRAAGGYRLTAKGRELARCADALTHGRYATPRDPR